MKDVLNYLFDRLKQPPVVTHTVDGQAYAVNDDGTLGEPVRELPPQWTKPTFSVITLSSMVELVKAKVDDLPPDVCLHVADHLTVNLTSLKADKYGHRHVYAQARHTEGAAFKFNEYKQAEDFLISFRRSFLFNEEAVKVQKLCSSLESGMSVNLADDGLSQHLEVKSGTSSRAPVTLPADGVPLIPWRTFRDAAQVESKFLLRLRGVKDGLPLVALFEIDETWKLDCINSIARYLREHCKTVPVVA